MHKLEHHTSINTLTPTIPRLQFPVKCAILKTGDFYCEVIVMVRNLHVDDNGKVGEGVKFERIRRIT